MFRLCDPKLLTPEIVTYRTKNIQNNFTKNNNEKTGTLEILWKIQYNHFTKTIFISMLNKQRIRN